MRITGRLTAALLLALAPAAGGAAPDARGASDPAPEAVLATLPFDPAAPLRTIVIDLAPKGNSRPLRFQLETGATNSFVTPRLAREMGVKVSRTKSDAYRRSTVLGRDVLFYVDTRRGDTDSTSGREWGLLGGDFLSRYVVELDFARQQVRFLDPERFEVPASAGAAGEAVLPIRIVGNRPGLRVSFDGQALDMMVATGLDLALLLSAESARAAGVATERLPRSQAKLQGVLASTQVDAGEVKKLEIGPFAFLRVFAAVAPHGFYNVGFPGDSAVGFDLLSQFLVRIDYPRQRLWLRRNPDAKPMFDPRVSRNTSGRQIWLEWRTPSAGERVAGPVGFVAVEGWAGVGDPIRHDVVIAIDVSGSTAIASGADVDGDGHVGQQRRNLDDWRTFNPRHLSSDVGDSVLAAEILAARRLVELLDPDRTRIGLVAFSEEARTLAPLGSERAQIEDVLEKLDGAWGAGSTNLADAVARGSEELENRSPGKVPRRKTLLVLSDGWPTAPDSERVAAEEALKQATAAAKNGVRIDSFGLGVQPRGDVDVYARIASLSGGSYHPLPEPADVVHELPRIDLAEVASVEIANASTGVAGRAVRVLPDGSFDGVVLLAAGENRIRVTARDEAGAARSDERAVFYDARAPRDAEEDAAFERRLAELKQKLEQRRLESELVAEIQATRKQRRELELHIEKQEQSP